MRYLFLSYIFPGPLGAMASWLANQEGNHVIFASTRSRQEMPLPNVQRVIVKTYPGKKNSDDQEYFTLWEEAVRAGKSVRSSLDLVKSSGFEADMIFNASSNGSGLGLRELFPDAFLLDFLEEETFSKPAQAVLRRDIQILQILGANMAFAFSEARRQSYPSELWSRIRLAPRVIDTSFFDPQSASPFSCPKFDGESRKLLTVFARGLAEKELFGCLGQCLEILKKREDSRIVFLVNGAYTMRRLSQVELPPNLGNRLQIEAHLRQDALRDLLCSSILSIFPGLDSSLAMLESMSCASCPMPEKHQYFLKDGWDSISLGKLEHMSGRVLELLEHPEALRMLGAHARKTALRDFSASVVMPGFFSQIEQAYREWNGGA